ncbi:hypothetical protein Pdsh_05615 [Pyrodictium delaneyi]|uniref:Uncharacterized protein n=1 Tax=Pyrodictium delaneyi TaxID=1273541 RepID=A0A211YQF6_9CREN|nr:hypothetical protein Pdsh_05615 [Pyrodictium delaneyi]
MRSLAKAYTTPSNLEYETLHDKPMPGEGSGGGHLPIPQRHPVALGVRARGIPQAPSQPRSSQRADPVIKRDHQLRA